MQWRGNYDDLIERGQGERIVVDRGGGDCGNFWKFGKVSGGHKKNLDKSAHNGSSFCCVYFCFWLFISVNEDELALIFTWSPKTEGFFYSNHSVSLTLATTCSSTKGFNDQCHRTSDRIKNIRSQCHRVYGQCEHVTYKTEWHR